MLPADTGHERLLALVEGGASREAALNAVVVAARESLATKPRLAIFVVDNAVRELRFAASSGLPHDYTKAVDHFGIDPKNPSCGSAAYSGENVIVGDVASDPKWAPFLALAQDHGIRACWSIVIKSGTRTLGTIAAYHDFPRLPSPQDIRILEEFAATASRIIDAYPSNV